MILRSLYKNKYIKGVNPMNKGSKKGTQNDSLTADILREKFIKIYKN